MKTREEIVAWVHDMDKFNRGNPITVNEKRAKTELIIELLLDIRDIALQIQSFK